MPGCRNLSKKDTKGQIEMSDIRNLWHEVRSAGDEDRRKLVGSGGRVLYGFFIVIGGALALDLYTRPDSIILKAFGIAAAIGLVVSDVFWAWATHHSAAGVQRWIARVFWSAGILIYALNVISEYQHYLGEQMNAITQTWYWTASIVTVVVAAVGWALYSMFSPEQQLADVSAKAKSDAVKALVRGIESPDEDTADAFNKQIIEAAHDLAQYAAGAVSGHVATLASRNGHERTRTLNESVEVAERKRPNA
jgi:hypothetical protein